MHVSGQVAQWPDGQMVGKVDIKRQTVQVLENHRTLVEKARSTLAAVARIVVNLTSQEHLPTVMKVRRRHFKETYPAPPAVLAAGPANSEWMAEIEAAAVLAWDQRR